MVMLLQIGYNSKGPTFSVNFMVKMKLIHTMLRRSLSSGRKVCNFSVPKLWKNRTSTAPNRSQTSSCLAKS